MTYNNIKFLFKDGHRIILLLVLCLFGLCLVASSVVPRTKGKRAADDERVYLVHADELKYDAYGLNPHAQIAKGKVHFRHKGANLWCDSAYFFQEDNAMQAFGHVRFRQGDTLSLTCDYAEYDGMEQMMMARRNVVMKHRGRTLYTDGWGDSMEGVTDAVIATSEVLGDVSDEDLSTVTEAAMGLEEVFGSDISESVRAVDVLMGRFGVSAQEATDLLVAGAQRGLDYTDELGDNIAEYSGRWGDAGVSASQYFSLLQAGVDAGAYSLDRVGDYLNEFLTSLSDGRMASSIGSLSAGTQAVWESYQAGGASALDMLNAVVGDLEDCESATERATVASELWGTLGEDNAMSVILALGDVEDSYGNVEGASEDLASTMEDTFDKRMASSVRSLQEAFEPLALAGMDALTGLLEFVEPAIEAFASLDAGTQATILSMAAVVPAASKVVGALKSIGSAKSALTSVADAAKGLSASIGGVSSRIAGLGIVGAGVAVAVAAISKYNEEVEASEQHMRDMEAASEGLGGALASIGGSGLDGVSYAASSASSSLGSAASNALEFSESMRSSLESARQTSSDVVAGYQEMARTIAEVYASNSQVQGFVDTIGELRDRAGLTEEEQARLNEAVRAFNDATGESVTVLDEQNGRLSETQESLQGLADAYARQAEVRAYEGILDELYENKIEQSALLEQAMDDMEVAAGKLGEAKAELYSLEEQRDADPSGALFSGLAGDIAEAKAEVEVLQGSFDDASESVRSYKSDLSGTQKSIDETTQAMAQVASGAEEAGESIGKAGESAEDAANSIDELNAALEPALKGMRGSAPAVEDWAEALDGIAESADPAADALGEVEMALAEFDKNGGDIHDLTRELNSALKETGEVTEDLTEEQALYMYQTGMTADQIYEYAKAQSDAADAAEEQAEAVEEERERIEELLGSYSDFASAHAGFTDVLDASGTDLQSFALGLDAVGISFEEFESTFESLASAVNPLERLSGETEMYTWKMRDNLVANTEAVRSYSANVAEMYSRVTNEQEMAFADYVAGLGIEYADFLNYLMWDADVSFPELAQAYADGVAAAMEGSMDIVDEQARAMARITGQSFEECKALIEAGAADSTSGVGDAMAEGADGSGAAEQASGEFAEGLLAGSGEAKTTADLLGEAAMDALMDLPSEMRARGEAAGGYLAIGLAQGSANIGPGVRSIVATIAAELVALPENLGTVGRVSGASLASGTPRARRRSCRSPRTWGPSAQPADSVSPRGSH